MPDALFDADALRGSTFVRHVEIHDALPSTNDRAAEMARTGGVSLPALIVARRQTAGRGRGASQWWSSDGALTFSLLLDADSIGIRAAQLPFVSLTTGVAVCDTLAAELQTSRASSTTPQLKWPNDVLLDGRKICGILIESPAGTAVADRCLIIGIGVNVNNSMAAAPPELQSHSISLCDAANHEFSLQNILTKIVSSLDQRVQTLASNVASLHAEATRLCFLTGKRVQIDIADRQIEGLCAGIAESGALLVETDAGRSALFSGTVRVSQ
jgi:BirA family biotin operon repressor/biotin-[acetyl-CoA-carboxylase] ligase